MLLVSSRVGACVALLQRPRGILHAASRLARGPFEGVRRHLLRKLLRAIEEALLSARSVVGALLRRAAVRILRAQVVHAFGLRFQCALIPRQPLHLGAGPGRVLLRCRIAGGLPGFHCGFQQTPHGLPCRLRRLLFPSTSKLLLGLAHVALSALHLLLGRGRSIELRFEPAGLFA